MESQPQNHEFRNNPENFHPCTLDYSDYCVRSFMENSIGPKKLKDASFTHQLGQYYLWNYRKLKYCKA